MATEDATALDLWCAIIPLRPSWALDWVTAAPTFSLLFMRIWHVEIFHRAAACGFLLM